MKNAFGIFIGIALNLYIALGSMDILIIPPVHEHRISFHLLYIGILDEAPQIL